jgi:hypothetical protein
VPSRSNNRARSSGGRERRTSASQPHSSRSLRRLAVRRRPGVDGRRGESRARPRDHEFHRPASRGSRFSRACPVSGGARVRRGLGPDGMGRPRPSVGGRPSFGQRRRRACLRDGCGALLGVFNDDAPKKDWMRLRLATSLLAGATAIGALGTVASSSDVERYALAPTYVAIALLCLLVARSARRGGNYEGRLPAAEVPAVVPTEAERRPS